MNADLLRYSRHQNLFVGKRAYDQAAFSPDNVWREFKRLMGTSTTQTFAGTTRTMTPEEASSEVLKALAAQARMIAGDFPIEGTVITVPAAFNQMQSEATMNAAHAAGLDRVALLQEPIAAALASISTSQNRNGQFLIYDLGGGTFDVAIVQSISGNATVVGHAGINMLGGRDFDRALVNSLVRPWLLRTFDLPPDFQRTYGRLIRVAQYRAEIAKIALSTQPIDRIFADENQIGTKDRQGEDIYLDVEVTRSDLEQLILEEIDRTIDLCRKTIAENGYRQEDIDRVVLIGGPSHMPLVRERIASQLAIRLDTNVDPMTAVGVGAALYAESRDWSGATAQPKRVRASTKACGPIDLRVDYPSRTTEQTVKIKVHCASVDELEGFRVQVDTDSGWTSGQISLRSTNEVGGVLVGKRGENRVRITVFDETAKKKEDSGIEFSVFRAGAAADAMPLMHNIAIKVVGGAIGAEFNTLHTIIKKGTAVPKSGSEQFGAARNFGSGDKSTLDFEVYQQAEGVNSPDLNLVIGAFRLSPGDLEKGEVIRRGDDVFVDWTVDENSLLECAFRIPSIQKDFAVKNMYVPAEGHRNYEGEDGHKLAVSALQSAQNDLEILERAIGAPVANQVVDMRKRLRKLTDDLKLSHDADTQRRITEEARQIRQEIAQLKNKPEFVKASVCAELDGFLETCSIEILPQLEEKTNTQVHRLAGAARDALKKGSPQAVEDAKHSFNELRAVILADLMKRRDFWIGLFADVAGDRHLAIDKNKHDGLVEAGKEAIERDDLDYLRSVVSSLNGNMIKGAEPSRITALAGLIRTG
jgi:molecular chaperone DnaK